MDYDNYLTHDQHRRLLALDPVGYANLEPRLDLTKEGTAVRFYERPDGALVAASAHARIWSEHWFVKPCIREKVMAIVLPRTGILVDLDAGDQFSKLTHLLADLESRISHTTIDKPQNRYPALKFVSGRIVVRPDNMFPELTYVGGSLSISNEYRPVCELPNLIGVGKSVYFDQDEPCVPKLRYVGESFAYLLWQQRQLKAPMPDFLKQAQLNMTAQGALQATLEFLNRRALVDRVIEESPLESDQDNRPQFDLSL